MTELVITAMEAWEEVDRLGVWIIRNSRDGKWYADIPGQAFIIGAGDSPLEAMTNLLGRVGEDANKQAKEAAV